MVENSNYLFVHHDTPTLCGLGEKIVKYVLQDCPEFFLAKEEILANRSDNKINYLET